MAATSKFDPSSGSPDRPTYPGGQRGAYSAASSSGSQREGMDNQIMSALPGMLRGASTSSHTDVLNFFHGLPFDSKQLAVGPKLPRQGDLNRVMNAALNTSPSDFSSAMQLPPSSLEDLKRVKTNLHDNSVRARDRVKIWNETTSRFDKCFHNIGTKRRPRSDGPSSDRVTSSLSIDRTVFGGISKMGTQNQTSALDNETLKLEERAKNVVPNKRTRTSLLEVQMDARANALARSHVAVERDRDILGLTNTMQSEEKGRALSNGGDGWEKSRMKKKRSGIKSDFSTGTASNRALDGDQESKRGMHQRLAADSRSRSSNALEFRSGLSGAGKLDTTCQKGGFGVRSTHINEQDNGSSLNDRRDLVGSDREKVNTKAFNRSNVRENNSSSNPSSTMKPNMVTRAPRSGPGAIPKASPSIQQSIGLSDDWELSQGSNKVHTVAAASNRKRMPSARSASPPVAQWAGQRPQKIPRVARRSNFVSPVLGHDEIQAFDTESNIPRNDNGLGFQRRLSCNALQQVKSKGDHFSSARLSESEESGAAEIKSKDKSRKFHEMDEKGGQNVPKAASQVLPSRKNKMPNEDLRLGGGVRRQGRTVRGFTSTRSRNPMSIDKRDNAVTAKQLRRSKPCFDKIESKSGRPPTKKLSDRKACTRPRHSVKSGVPDFRGESDDGHEELLAAANAAVNSAVQACSSLFWKQVYPFFRFLSAEDIDFVKRQSDCLSRASGDPACGHDSTTISADGIGLVESEGDPAFTDDPEINEHLSGQVAGGKRVPSAPSLFDRLLSAFVVDEGDGDSCGRQEDFEFDVYGGVFEPDLELKCDSWNQRSLGNIQTVGRSSSNGYRITATRGYLDKLENDDLECTDIMTDTNVETIGHFGHSLGGFQPDQALMPIIACTQSQYDQMPTDERLLLEVQSIGLLSEPMSDLSQSEDEVYEEMKMLQEKLHEQALMKKQYLRNLEKSMTEAKEIQDRDIKGQAMDELVIMAYERYMTCWGPNASCGKGMSGKLAKQASLAFVERTIERCEKFDNASENCFSDSIFRDIFHSVSPLVKSAESVISDKEGDSSKVYADAPIRSPGVIISAPLGSRLVPSLISQSGQNIGSHEKFASDDIRSVNHLSEQPIEKEDGAINRNKKRELLLDEVVGGAVGTSLRAPSGIGSSLLCGAKGKRSERDREGKGKNRELQSRNGTAKIGRPSLGNAKGERKSKAKPKQRTTQLLASVNNLLGRTSEISTEYSAPVQESHEMIINRKAKKNADPYVETLLDPEAIDLSNLQLPEMDVLGASDDLGGQGEDFASWLNIDVDGLQDHDFGGGLEIPMDDLTELNMIP